MNRQLTALFAAFEALLVAAVGIAIPLVALTLLWGFHYGLAIDWTVFWRVAVDAWLVGHGVDITVALDAATAASFGVPEEPFSVTIAALGFALLTVLLAIRAGRRVAETRYLVFGQLVSLATFAVISFAVTSSAMHPLARPSLVQGSILPTLVFAVGMAIGVRQTRAEQRTAGQVRALPIRDDALNSFRGRLDNWRPAIRTVVTTSLRGGAAAAAAILAVAALVTTAAILLSYARIITLYQGLHTEVLGGAVVTLGEMAVLPNLVVYTASWLVGPGFAIGAGSSVGPFGTLLGPIPALPVLGALPQGQLAMGFLGLLAPVVIGFLIGAVLGPGARLSLGRAELAMTAVGVGLVGGVILGLLASIAGGAVGPGRLAVVGPDPWMVGGLAAVELAVSAGLGMFASLRRSGRMTEAAP